MQKQILMNIFKVFQNNNKKQIVKRIKKDKKTKANLG
jgi:hypothetical protein